MNQNDNHYVMLMADCLPVKGVTRSAIYDFSRGDVHMFPSDFFDLFSELEQRPYGELKHMALQSGHLEDFEAFIDFLDQNEMIIFVSRDERALFPKIDLDTWDRPCVIQNAIVDLGDRHFDFEAIIHQLDGLGCEFVQIRQFGNGYTLDEIESLVKASYDKSIQSLELLLCFDARVSEQCYQDLLLRHPIIAALSIHSAPETKVVSVDVDPKGLGVLKRDILFSRTQVASSDHCGVITQRTLNAPETRTVAEFKGFNGCLNRKIGIDQYGNIKNCPSMQTSFGSIFDGALSQVVAQPAFQQPWGIKKDDIAGCRDCEYRYLCSDCRAFTQDGDPFGKPAKCQYNPVTTQWGTALAV